MVPRDKGACSACNSITFPCDILHESGSWLKTHVRFFSGLTRGFAWQASWGQLTCPHHPFINRQSQDTEQSCVENACSPVSRAFWTIFPFLAQVPSFLGMFSLRPWAKVFLRCLYLWGRRGNPWRHPPPCSDSVPVPFHSQPDPEPSYLTAGVHKMARTFCLGLPHQWDGPKCLCWSTWLWWALPQEKQNRGSQCFFLV